LRRASGGLLALRHGVVIHLAADRLGLHQRAQALGLHPRPRQGRLGALQGSGCAVHLGLERRRVDLEQHGTGLDLGALLEQAALHDAADLRANLGAAHGDHTRGQVLADRQLVRLERQHRHLQRCGCLGLLRRRVAPCQPEYGKPCEHDAQMPLFTAHDPLLVARYARTT
jgi:hypothetical protein